MLGAVVSRRFQSSGHTAALNPSLCQGIAILISNANISHHFQALSGSKGMCCNGQGGTPVASVVVVIRSDAAMAVVVQY